MPNYDFKHNESGETQSVFLRISQYDDWRKDNPDWERYYPQGSVPAIVSGTKSALTMAGAGWQEHLKHIKKTSGKDNTIKTQSINNMNREEVFEQLKIDEGVVYEVYLDHLNYPTFGVGHLIKESDGEFGAKVGTQVSPERVAEAFDQDLDTAISECTVLYGDGFSCLPDEVQQILVNMMFNMGRPRLSQFKNMNTAINNGDWKTAAIEGRDSRWHKQVTNRAERLMVRLENV